MAAPERFAEKSDLLLQRGHRPYMAHRDISRRRNERRAHLLRLWHSRQSRLESDAQQRMAAIREILPGAGEQGKSLRELKTAERALKAEKPAKAGRAKR